MYRRLFTIQSKLRGLHQLSPAKPQRRYRLLTSKANPSFSVNHSWNKKWFATTSGVDGDKKSPNDASNVNKPLDLSLLYRYLQLESFTEEEIRLVFARIQQQQDQNDVHPTNDSNGIITHGQLTKFLIQRFQQIENFPRHDNEDNDKDESIRVMQQDYAAHEATRMFHVFQPTVKADDNNDNSDSDKIPGNPSLSTTSTISLDTFVTTLRTKATNIDVPGMWPITVSMLLVGSSVGILTPAMPFVVEQLGLSPGQYGYVVSAFALAKMAGNIPSAILVERHGRKPYLVYSLSIVAVGVAGMGFATEFEHLYLCRLLTGFGVAGLSTAATMSITDLSTPLNRASTMAPIMSAFAAGTALGPAIGGYLVDGVGLQSTFYLVGASYLGLTLVNAKLLRETKPQDIIFPWQKQQQQQQKQQQQTEKLTAAASQASMWTSIQSAVRQWVPLLKDTKIRNIMIMQGFYWVALAGAQMTLLPLLLTNPDGLALTATQVGHVYMGTSLVQVLGNPVFARLTDRVLGKRLGIVTGCTLISASMASLPFCTDMYSLAATMATWAAGSSFLSTAPVAYISDHVEPHQRAQALALLRTAGDIGFLLGATGIGTLADRTGDLNVAMTCSAGVLFTATAWFATRRQLSLASASALQPSSPLSTSTTTTRITTTSSSTGAPSSAASQSQTDPQQEETKF